MILWKRLKHRLDEMVEQFEGVAGVCVRDLAHERSIAVNGDEEFPTASAIKLHVLIQLLTRGERGDLDLEKKVRVTREVFVPGGGVITSLGRDIELTVSDLAVLMIIVSDNTAANLCIDLAGMEETNALLRELGLSATTIRRKMFDARAISLGQENVATPAECVSILELLYNGKPTKAVADRCLEILKYPKRETLNQAIPPDVPVANKPGGMPRVHCDAGIVYLPRRPYVIAVMTKFGVPDPLDQQRFVTDVARNVHKTMVTLDTTNDYGLAIPA